MLREQMGLECREEQTNVYRTNGHATDHPVDYLTSQKQKLDLFVCLFVILFALRVGVRMDQSVCSSMLAFLRQRAI